MCIEYVYKIKYRLLWLFFSLFQYLGAVLLNRDFFFSLLSNILRLHILIIVFTLRLQIFQWEFFDMTEVVFR